MPWSYGEDPSEHFYSAALGACYRLPNGNTLIVESNAGRILEITPDKAIVWEWTNPNIVGRSKEKIAVILDAVRLPKDFSLNWKN